MARTQTRIIALCIMVSFGFPAAAELPSPPAPGTYSLEIKSGGWDRVAHVHIPVGYKSNVAAPLVLAFHGAGGSGEMMLLRNGWAAKADQEGFLVVAPTGLPSRPRLKPDFRANPQVWNSGQLNPVSPRTQVDDVQFTMDLLEELKQRVPYDEKRVFVTGHSNGAGMTFRLGAERSERVAALAPVAGMLSVADPKPAKPLPTLFIIGTKDPLQPLEGGEVSLPWGTRSNPPVSQHLTSWAKAIGCATTPSTLSDKDGLKKVEYASLTKGPSLTVIYIEGHGHEWPGGRSGLPETVIGVDTKKLDATDAIWSFFKDQK